MATKGFDLEALPDARTWPKRLAERQRVLAPLLGVDSAYLNAMFEALATQSGSIEEYIREALGLDDGEREAISECSSARAFEIFDHRVWLSVRYEGVDGRCVR